MNNDLNIYVLQHKPYVNRHEDLENRVPLQVGAWDKEAFCIVRDCTGDNISNKNKTYLETTGHYWILKNDIQSEYVGVEHCCRQFLELDTKEKILEILKDYDIILPQPNIKINTFLADICLRFSIIISGASRIDFKRGACLRFLMKNEKER